MIINKNLHIFGVQEQNKKTKFCVKQIIINIILHIIIYKLIIFVCFVHKELSLIENVK